jgi:hypothetical protein
MFFDVTLVAQALQVGDAVIPWFPTENIERVVRLQSSAPIRAASHAIEFGRPFNPLGKPLPARILQLF